MEIEISKDAKMATFTHGGCAITVDLRERADIERLQHVLLDAEMECRMIPAYIDPGIPLTPEQDEEIRDRLHATPSADEPTALAFTDFAKEKVPNRVEKPCWRCDGRGRYWMLRDDGTKRFVKCECQSSDVDEDYRKGAEALAEFVADHDWGEPPVDVGEGWVETSRAKATYYRTRLPGEGWDETGWKPICGCQDCSDIIYQFRKPAGVRFGRPEGE